MEEFVGLELDFSGGSAAEEAVDLLAPGVEVAVVHSEVGKGFVVLGLQPELRVAENDEKVVVGHHSGVGLGRLEGPAVGQGEEQPVSVRHSLRFEPALGPGRQKVAVEQLDDHNEVVLAVDVPVHVCLVEGVVPIDHSGPCDGELSPLLDDGQYVVFEVVLPLETVSAEELSDVALIGVGLRGYLFGLSLLSIELVYLSLKISDSISF